MNDSIIELSDSYKVSHSVQYPPDTSEVYSYFESRGGDSPETVFFGLTYQLRRFLKGEVVTLEKIEKAKALLVPHMGQFNELGWKHIVRDHLGTLPISIHAVPEGTVVPVGHALMTVRNTCPNCYWLTNYLETLLVQNWYPTTVATSSRQIKKLILGHLEATGDPTEILFKLHDFGCRGVSCMEQAAIGGAGHLVNFKGTDTIPAVRFLMDHYRVGVEGYSIPAAEHSTITSWGKEHEVDAFRNMLDQYPTGLVAVVSDSFDIRKACYDYWGGTLRERILSREGVLVVRPDSGDPVETVSEVVSILAGQFGTVTNEKGYKLLPPQLRVIQGDGVTYQIIDQILTRLKILGFSASNLTFGMGGALLQRLDRDTQKFAFKCSSIVRNGERQNVFKESPGKQSKRGTLSLIKTPNGYETIQGENAPGDQLVEYFRDGDILRRECLTDIRERAAL